MFSIRSSLKFYSYSKCFNPGCISSTEIRNVKRWVAPTLRELKKRADKMELDKQINPRSGFVEWNYRAELFAFGKRLNEEFQMPLLQAAFTERSYVNQEQEKQRSLGIEVVDINLTDNFKLAEHGRYLMNQYIEAFLQHFLPNVPQEGREAISIFLKSTKSLAYVASHLGMKDLIFSTEYPPSDYSLAQSLQAVVGALAESSGIQRSFLFIRDFICTQLNQKDLTEIWEIKEPLKVLENYCKTKHMENPEPRLIGERGKNTILATYEVGIYSNKKMLGKGFGEDISTAINTASLDALLKIYAINDSMKPFNFKANVEPNNLRLTQ